MRGTDRAAGLSLDPARLTLSGLSLGLWTGKQSATGRARCTQEGELSGASTSPADQSVNCGGIRTAGLCKERRSRQAANAARGSHRSTDQMCSNLGHSPADDGTRPWYRGRISPSNCPRDRNVLDRLAEAKRDLLHSGVPLATLQIFLRLLKSPFNLPQTLNVAPLLQQSYRIEVCHTRI